MPQLSSYDDSVSSVVGWVSESKPKRNWDIFWSSATKSISEGTKKVFSVIGIAISSVAYTVLGIPDTFSLGKLFNLGGKTQTGERVLFRF